MRSFFTAVHRIKFKIIDNEEHIFTSIAYLWEIAIKHSIGKLDLEVSIKQIEELCKQKDISILPIASNHLDELENLPNHHNDPFDRLIICQARTEELTIITRDTIYSEIPRKNRIVR